MLGRGAVVALALALLSGVGTARAASYTTVPFETRAADGVVLRGSVYLPSGAPRPLAALLEYSPYYEGESYTFQRTDQRAGDPEIAYLLDAGFAVAEVSMRGTGQSGGCLHFGDVVDQRDAATVIQALAAQPWSNGNIGMIGHSYPAWTQMMAAAQRPPALKAIVPTSGVTDLWNLLTRRGASLVAAGTIFGPLVTVATGHLPPAGIAQLLCPDILAATEASLGNALNGDRTPWYAARDLRSALTDTPVATMTSLGIVSGYNDGHILQLEGMWDRLRHDRTRFVLGQWAHETPTDHKPGWHAQVVGWFDHYLRGGPVTVPGGVVEYQDDTGAWHTSDRWPPAARSETVRVSGRQSLVSLDLDPGLKLAPEDRFGRTFASVCGPHQALYATPPLAADTLIAGNFDADLEVSDTLPGGNFAVLLWRSRTGACPDSASSWFARALMDLRHWDTPGAGKDFPVGRPTHVHLRSEPFAAVVHKGERIVVAIGGGALEIEPDPLHGLLTVSGGSVTLPVVSSSRRRAGHPRVGIARIR